MTTELATFAAGCFWGVEDAFRRLPGVIETEVGYTGGTTPNPSYELVCSSTTGHAEALQITFDPSVVTYQQLLDRFWKIHDPTTMNRQGPDHGSQYRSAIFYHSPVQQQAAIASREALEQAGTYDDPIVTEIKAIGPWYPAEAYHQHYTERTGRGACHVVL